MQNSALRCCYNVSDPRDEHISDLDKNANVEMLDVRRRKPQLLCILWRNVQTGFIELYTPVRITRGVHGKSVRLPIPRTEQYKKSTFYLGCKAWNELDEDVREIIVLKEFKKKL